MKGDMRHDSDLADLTGLESEEIHENVQTGGDLQRWRIKIANSLAGA